MCCAGGSTRGGDCGDVTGTAGAAPDVAIAGCSMRTVVAEVAASGCSAGVDVVGYGRGVYDQSAAPQSSAAPIASAVTVDREDRPRSGPFALVCKLRRGRGASSGRA